MTTETRHVYMVAEALAKLRGHPVEPGDFFVTPNGSSITAI